MLEGLRDRFGWAEVREAGTLIGLVKDGANVSLEPGGQLELSGAPLETIHQTCDEVNAHLREVKSIADEIGAGFIGLGAAPTGPQDQMPVMPKGRYALMTPYMGRVGTTGTMMMYRTCTVQVNLDFASEADMVAKFRTSLALQPVATALFANSPFFDGRVNGWQSWRARIWRDLDPARTGMLPFVFEEGMGFERYVDYALDVPMYFVYRDGRYIDALGQSFRDFLDGRLPALPGEKPTLRGLGRPSDDDLSRGAAEEVPRDARRRRRPVAARSARCRRSGSGLLYDAPSLAAAWDLCRDWTRGGPRGAAPRRGEVRPRRRGPRAAAARRGARGRRDRPRRAARPGARRGAGGAIPDETHFLDALAEIVATGQTAVGRAARPNTPDPGAGTCRGSTTNTATERAIDARRRSGRRRGEAGGPRPVGQAAVEVVAPGLDVAAERLREGRAGAVVEVPAVVVARASHPLRRQGRRRAGRSSRQTSASPASRSSKKTTWSTASVPSG